MNATPAREQESVPLAPAPMDTAIEIRSVPIAWMRVDGDTQHRIRTDAAVVSEYATLMSAGVEFPPVRLWHDDKNYWLTDGFHRVAAAMAAGLTELKAEVLSGSLEDAQWDSYAVNAVHGIRRTAAETRRVVWLALHHPNAARRSNVEIARHVHVPEATLRRWRKALSSSSGEDKTRMVTRGGSRYLLRTARIGQSSRTRTKSRRDLQTELTAMKERSTPRLRRLLNIVGNWALGRATPEACLEALERVAEDWGHPSACRDIREDPDPAEANSGEL